MGNFYIHAKYAVVGETCSKIMRDVGILVEDGIIIKIGKHDEVSQYICGHYVFNRQNHIVIPPFVNAHTHLAETLLRGICDNKALDVWLNDYIWPFESKLTGEYVYHGALLGCLELIEAGVGGLIDQYFFIEHVEKAVSYMRLKALLCPSIFDGTPESGSIENTWHHVKNIIKSRIGVKKDKNASINFGIGPHAPYSVPEEYLLKISDFASKYSLPIHIHLNETVKEVVESQKQHGLNPIEYIDKLGLTQNRILAAHCVHTSEKEQKIMKKKNFTVLHCPQSNLKLASGIAPIYKYLMKGINIAIGTDGSGSNNDLGVIEEMNTMALLQKYLANDPSVISHSEALYMATVAGMKAMGFDSKGLTEGYPADFTILIFKAARLWPQNNPYSNIIFSATSADVNDLILNGIPLYLNQRHQRIDKEKIIEEANDVAMKLMESMDK